MSEPIKDDLDKCSQRAIEIAQSSGTLTLAGLKRELLLEGFDILLIDKVISTFQEEYGIKDQPNS